MVKKDFKAISKVILALEANPRDGHGECNEHNVDKERAFNLYEKIAPSLNTAKKYIWRTEDASGDITDLIKQEVFCP